MWGNYSAGRRGMPQGPAGFGMNNGGAWAGASAQNMGIGGMNPWMMGLGGGNEMPQNPTQFMGGGANRNMQVPSGFGGYQNPMAMYQLPNMGQGPMSRPQNAPWMMPGYSMQGNAKPVNDIGRLQPGVETYDVSKLPPAPTGDILQDARALPDGTVVGRGDARFYDPNAPHLEARDGKWQTPLGPEYYKQQIMEQLAKNPNPSPNLILSAQHYGLLPGNTLARSMNANSGGNPNSWPTQMIQNNPFMSRLPQSGGNSMMGSGAMSSMGLNPQILQMLMGMRPNGATNSQSWEIGPYIHNPQDSANKPNPWLNYMIPRASWGYK